MNINDKVKELIIDKAGLDKEISDIKNEEYLLSGGYNLDSVVIIEIISELEEIFDIIFDDEDISLENFSSVNNIVNIVKSKGV